jgi:predicted MPP superfamily phosphohydrolase
MFAKRYALIVLGLLPILLTYLTVAVQAWKRVKKNRRSLLLWRVGAGLWLFLILLSLLTEFRVFLWIPRMITASTQAAVNLSGFLGAVLIPLWLLFRVASRGVPVTFRQDRRLALRALAGVSIAAPVGIASFGVFVERTNFEICQHKIGLPNLPLALDGIRLLQISDIHLSPYLSETRLARVVDSANELKADFTFITGDLISSKGDPLDACLAQLSRLKSVGPKLGCMGNHEVYADSIEYTERQGARLGIDFLRCRARAFRFGDAVLNIAGVDYQPMGSRYLKHGASMIVPGAVNVLLSHNPDVFPVAAKQGYDLTLAGHTHGGQVTFELLSPALNPARMLTPYVRGIYHEGSSVCYVNRGIGTLGVPARLGARPEITLLTLKRV